MNLVNAYHSLPYPLKTLAASIHGYRLRWWRYGSNTEKLVEETLERDHWSRDQWKTWQDEQLAFILHRAATQVPYYRDQWQKRRALGDKSSWEVLANWPILDKSQVRDNPTAFISETSRKKLLYVDHTGGTTGRPTLIYESRKTIIKWYAIYEARIRRWHNLDYHERWGILGGQKIIPLSQKVPPFWVLNQGLNQIYFSIFHISETTAESYVNALWKYRPTHLMVYPSTCAVLARHMILLGLQPPKIKAIITNSEKLTRDYKELIIEAFNCPVYDTYGMAELTAAASECDQGGLHYWPETGVLEVFNHENNTITSNTDQTGNLLMTGLLNEDMPLIRYMNKDIGQLPDWSKNCDCHRTLPIIPKIIGRNNDLIKTKDGRQLYILDSLYNGLPIIEGQMIQKDLDNFEVNVIPDNQYDRDLVYDEIQERLKYYLGDIQLSVCEVKNLQQNTNGKAKPFVSLIG
ncbi:MAG TPA: AMP-binding protein [Anaerolinea sp.]|nr:AMP-binding protein [Anaerolinea sp.]